MINICVPVLKRYDLLQDLIRSLESSIVQPDAMYVIDNGQRMRTPHATRMELGGTLDYFTDVELNIHVPAAPMGVAESWNWFIRNVKDDRVIANDDIQFAPESIGLLTASPADLVWAAGCGFSCFVLRDACVAKIGEFDETISPGYGYYEDEDYLQRLDGRGTREPSAVAANVDCGVRHVRSGTLRVATAEEIMEHDRKFKIAQNNYIKKWHLEDSFR